MNSWEEETVGQGPPSGGSTGSLGSQEQRERVEHKGTGDKKQKKQTAKLRTKVWTAAHVTPEVRTKKAL